MPNRPRALTGLAALLTLLATPATAQVIRHANTPTPGIILQSVTVKPGAEMLYLSGQLAAPLVPGKTEGIEAYGDTKTQTASVLTKIKAILASHGYAMSDVIKLTVFLAGDPKLGGKLDAAGMNEAFKTFFGSADNPNTVARSTVQVAALVNPNFLVEIEATAAKVPAR